MKTEQVHAHLDDLVAQERELLDRGVPEDGLSEQEDARLAAIKVELDSYSELHSQRRPPEGARLDREAAQVVAAESVDYLQ